MNSNCTTDSITLNSCQLLYLVQNNNLTQTRSYVLAPNIQEEQRPVSNNLKLFYENSGNLENSILLNNVQYVASPPAAPKQVPVQENNVAAPNGNNLKLASFLVPKKDAANKQYIATISNKILKPTVSCSNTNVLPNLVSTNVRSKPNPPRTLLRPRILPKIQPKEKTPERTKHSAVHLLKLGGAYHSLNQLNEEQMRLVNQALEKIGTDPEKTTLKPAYDPVTNTRIVYKVSGHSRVVSPNDLKLVGKNKIIVKASAIKKEDIIRKEDLQFKKEEIFLKKEQEQEESGEEDKQDAEVIEAAQVKVTRSGRAVKLPRHRAAAAPPPPPRARRARPPVPCRVCKAEFPTVYRLQRHYDKLPAHAAHASLVPWLACAVRGAAREARGAALLARLRELLAGLRALLPCLLRGAGDKTYVDDDLARLFGIDAGLYSINVDALSCVKDEQGFCKHNPRPAPPPPPPSDLARPAPARPSKQQEEPANVAQVEVDDCARIHPVDKWPIKNAWKHKLDETEQKPQTKRVKLTSETIEPLIELGSETIENIIGETIDNHQSPLTFVVEATEENLVSDKDKEPPIESAVMKLIETKRAKGSHSQFYSTHFDIRSSPIKSTSAVFNKFQIVPEKIPLKFDAALLRPLSFDTNETDNPESVQNTSDNSLDLAIFKELTSSGAHDPVMTSNDLTNGGEGKEPDELDRLALATAKAWSLPTPTRETECMKPNSLIEHSMILVQDNGVNTTNYDNSTFDSAASFNDNPISNNDNLVGNDNMINESRISLNQSSSSVLNFLDSFGEVSHDLSCQDNELRNTSIDFQLDLFSFHNS